MQQTDVIGGERRSDRRYEIKLELRWKLVRRRRVIESGIGHTRDLSRGGIRFYAGCELPIGQKVDLSISWPVRLHNVAPMLLAVHGKVVRSEGGWVAIRTLQHEFRTQGVVPERRDATAKAPNMPGVFTAAVAVIPRRLH